MDSLAKLFSRGTLKRAKRRSPDEMRRVKMFAVARQAARVINRRNRELAARQNRLNKDIRKRAREMRSSRKLETRRNWCRRAIHTCRNIT